MELDEEASDDDEVARSSLNALLIGAEGMLFDAELLCSREEAGIFEKIEYILTLQFRPIILTDENFYDRRLDLYIVELESDMEKRGVFGQIVD